MIAHRQKQHNNTSPINHRVAAMHEKGDACTTQGGCDHLSGIPATRNDDVKALNKLARRFKSHPVKLQFGPLTRPLRTIGFLHASYRNNEDGSSQRGMTVFLAESRERSSIDGMPYASLIDYESQKIEMTVLSTTVADYGWTYLVCKELGNNIKNNSLT